MKIVSDYLSLRHFNSHNIRLINSKDGYLLVFIVIISNHSCVIMNMQSLSRVQQAARLARIRSSQGLVPFAETFQHLQELKAQSKHKDQPLVLLTENTHAIFVPEGKQDFIFQSENDPRLRDCSFKSRIIEKAKTDYGTIWILPEEAMSHNNDISGSFRSMRGLALANFDNPTALSYLAHASVTLDYKTHAQYCTRCGTKRIFAKSPCPGCGLERYPRQSPCAIVLVYDKWNDSILLGQRTGGKIWSLLAGFCESLESIENCAVREVMEESQVVIDRASVEISVTQPWPFFTQKFEGTSLMMGCFAEASCPNQQPKPCADELGDVQWFPLEKIRKLWSEDSDLLPMRTSMARFLISSFLDSTSAT